MSLPKRICLCGYMGAGKSEIGRLLAERLGYRFVDLDRVIEDSQQRTVAQIFASEGEHAFRRLEVQLGLEALTSARVVIALGGGALTSDTLRRAVNSRAHLIYLKAAPAALFERAARAGARPLLDGVIDLETFRHRFEEHMNTRARHYEAARLTVATDELDPAATVERIAKSLQQENRHAG